MKLLTQVVLLLGLIEAVPAGAQPTVDAGDLAPLVTQLQEIVKASDIQGFLSLLAPETDVEAARDFARSALRDEVSRAVVVPRFILPMEDFPEGTGYELTVEVFTERGDRGRLQTWLLDVSRVASTEGTTPAWKIARHVGLDAIEGLHHLRLNTAKQYNAANLVIAGEDMTLQMSRGAAFVSETEAGVTALVLVGQGSFTFSPAPEAERRQVDIFSGEEILEAEFTHAFIRLNPDAIDSRISRTTLVETPIDRDDLKEAQELFDELAPLTFSVDLADLSEQSWWITPNFGDFIAELVTRRYGHLTYAQAQNQPEDISLYGRNPHRIISIYPSATKRAVRGRYYSDKDGSSYDVLDYNIEASFEPRGVSQDSLQSRPRLRGCWVEGVTRLALRVATLNVRSLTLRLNDDLRVHAVTSRELGPLLFFRMSGQNNIVINLPSEAPIGTEFTLSIAYSGLLKPDVLNENWIGRIRYLSDEEELFGVIERRYLYSNASYWYPQATVSDYATATMTLTIPADYGVVASGDPDDGNPPVSSNEKATGVRRYTFVTLQPTRYLSCLITRFVADDSPDRQVALDERDTTTAVVRPGVSYDHLTLKVKATENSRNRIEGYSAQAAAILRFYASRLGDIPYPTFTLALSDSRLPGGHSPAYFAVLNQLVPTRVGGMMVTWRTDPVAFSDHPTFFLAHELAHQWWGQAIGWKNYHEQWLSEGLAQYFAALHVQEQDGDEAFEDILSELRRWSIRHSDQGPVYLGYRLGLIDAEPRVFRALVYNKAALVLHMLRRLIGDEAFFGGLRRFYNSHRFKAAGTDDLVRAFETEAKRSLEDFFERWIHDYDLPTLRFDYRTETRLSGQQGETDVILRFEQQGQPFEIPVTATLRYRSGAEEMVIVPVSGEVTEFRVPLSAPLRDVDVNKDNAALTEIRQ